MVTEMSFPPYSVDAGESVRRRFEHHLEWCPGWEYTTTSVYESELADPANWDYKATRPDGFQANLDRGIGYDEAQGDWTKVAPGVLRNPRAASGPMLIAYWMRKSVYRYGDRYVKG